MRPLSAVDAFTPALERTKAMLLPFSLRRGLKLGLIALLAEMSAQFIAPPVGNFGHSSPPLAGGTGAIAHQVVVAFAVIGVVFFVLGLALLYFGSRMQFVLMDLVATRTTVIGPSWRKYGPKTWPWIGLKVLSFLAIFAVIGAVIAVPLIHLFRSMPSNNGQPPDAAFFGSFFLIFGTIFLAVFLMMLAIWTLRDFVLPFMVFEDATIGTALSSATKLIGREPGSVMFYFLMKFVFTMVAGLAAELCILVAAFVGIIPIGLVGGALWLGLHQAGSFGTAVLYVGYALLGLIFLAFMLVVGICLSGAVLIFYQAYTLYFLGGRIPTLGDLLEPPPPPLMEVIPPPFIPG
jgi:hypothetical protein